MFLDIKGRLSETTLKLAEEMADQCANELHNYYVYELKLTNYAARLSKLNKLVPIMEVIHVRFYRAYSLFPLFQSLFFVFFLLNLIFLGHNPIQERAYSHVQDFQRLRSRYLR